MKLRPATEIFDQMVEARESCHEDLMGKIAEAIDVAKSCGYCLVGFNLTDVRTHFDDTRVILELRQAGYVVSCFREGKVRTERLIINWRTAKSTV